MFQSKGSRRRYSSIDRAYFFQDLRSEALKAISWPSRWGAIVIPASGDAQTVNCAGRRPQTGGGWRGRWRWRRGLFFTWWHDPVVEGRVVGANGPHEAEQAAAKHGRQEGIKCSIEEEDQA